MGIGTYIAIYFIVWWTVIFAVLPWGVRSQAESGSVEEGTDPGSPVRPMLLRKAAVTTVIAAVIVVLLYTGIESGWLTLDRFPTLFTIKQ